MLTGLFCHSNFIPQIIQQLLEWNRTVSWRPRSDVPAGKETEQKDSKSSDNNRVRWLLRSVFAPHLGSASSHRTSFYSPGWHHDPELNWASNPPRCSEKRSLLAPIRRVLTVRTRLIMPPVLQNVIQPAVARTPAALVPAPLPRRRCWRVAPGYGAPALPSSCFWKTPSKNLAASRTSPFFIELISDCGDLHRWGILELHWSAWEHHLWWRATTSTMTGAGGCHATRVQLVLCFGYRFHNTISTFLWLRRIKSRIFTLYLDFWKCRELFFVCVRLLDYDRNYVVDHTAHVGICGDHPFTWSLYNIPTRQPTGSSSRQQNEFILRIYTLLKVNFNPRV